MDNKYLKQRIIMAQSEVFVEDKEKLYSYMQAMSSEIKKHSEGVARIATYLGIKYGLSDDDLFILSTAGLLHDIGKIYISPVILYKATKLNSAEFNKVKEHPVNGATILDTLDVDDKIVDITRHHHEKIDGSGYPDGLKGEEISFFTQIITVADMFDALVYKRSYKIIHSAKEAIDILRNTDGINQEIVSKLEEMTTEIMM